MMPPMCMSMSMSVSANSRLSSPQPHRHHIHRLHNNTSSSPSLRLFLRREQHSCPRRLSSCSSVVSQRGGGVRSPSPQTSFRKLLVSSLSRYAIFHSTQPHKTRYPHGSRCLCASSSSSSSSSSVSSAAAASESLITVRVYAKEISTSPNHTNVDTTNDCPLCEALVNKCEKFMQAVAYDPASRLNQANLEIVRLPNEHPKAISTPFITICLGNSQEEIQVDRPSPRASAQQVQRVVEKAVLAAAAAQQ
ncbi:hypothetical protein NFJ02_06g124880 [Pycnococcus provasolii]